MNKTLWSDWDILDAIARGHGLTPQARERALELAKLGCLDVTGTWTLTEKGRGIVETG
jgi:hypothetical protein